MRDESISQDNVIAKKFAKFFGEAYFQEPIISLYPDGYILKHGCIGDNTFNEPPQVR